MPCITATVAAATITLTFIYLACFSELIQVRPGISGKPLGNATAGHALQWRKPLWKIATCIATDISILDHRWHTVYSVCVVNLTYNICTRRCSD